MKFTYPVFKYSVEGGISREELGVVKPNLDDPNVHAEAIGLVQLGISLETVKKDISKMVWMTIFLTTFRDPGRNRIDRHIGELHY